MSRPLQLGNIEVDESKLADVCRRYRVRELSFFGSAVRGEMRPDSDIDMLVEFLPDASIDLVDYAGLMVQKLSVIGEAAARVSEESKAPYPEVPWPQIIAFRNILIHAYFGIDWDPVWRAARNRCPVLRNQVASMLGDSSGLDDKV